MCKYCNGEWNIILENDNNCTEVCMGKSPIAKCYCIDLNYEKNSIFYGTSTVINYCPFCGRKLEDNQYV